MSKKVISRKQLPVKLPLGATIAIVALLKAYNASEVVWAVAITLLVIIWISSIVSLFQDDEKEIDL